MTGLAAETNKGLLLCSIRSMSVRPHICHCSARRFEASDDTGRKEGDGRDAND